MKCTIRFTPVMFGGNHSCIDIQKDRWTQCSYKGPSSNLIKLDQMKTYSNSLFYFLSGLCHLSLKSSLGQHLFVRLLLGITTSDNCITPRNSHNQVSNSKRTTISPWHFACGLKVVPRLMLAGSFYRTKIDDIFLIFR